MKIAPRGYGKGFTLIELLIVIAIIGFLAAAVLVAVDPVKRIQDSRDSRRSSEVNALLNAILNKQVDDRGIFNGLPSAPVISSGTLGQVIITGDSANVIDCDTPANAPTCPAVTLSTANGRDCVAALGGLMAGDADSSGTTVDVSGMPDYATDIVVGDVLVDADGVTCEVTAVDTGADTVTCAVAPSPAYSSATLYNKTRSIVPNYIAEIPSDPRGSGYGPTDSGYYIKRNSDNRIEIGSCDPEQATDINVKR